MPDAPATELQRCSLCGLRLSHARIRSLLRRRALATMLGAGVRSQQAMVNRLAALGFPATRSLVSRDLKLLKAQRIADVRWIVGANPKEKRP